MRTEEPWSSTPKTRKALRPEGAFDDAAGLEAGCSAWGWGIVGPSGR